jgi:hypothetical protein
MVLRAMLLLAAWPGTAFACAVCAGDPGAPVSRGLTWAILVLVGVVGCVLAGVISFFVHAVRHSTDVTDAPEAESPKPD